MATKRKAGADDLEAELKRAQEEIKRLKQELQELKEKHAGEAAPSGAAAMVEITEDMTFQQRAFLANRMLLQAIQDGNVNRNTSGVHAVVVTHPHELNVQRAFHYAVECNQLQIVKFLYHVFGAGNELNPALKGRIKLDELGSFQRRTRVQEFEDTDRETPLQTAARLGHVDVLRYLLAAGAKETVRTPRRRFSLLHIAAIENQAEVIRELVQRPSVNINIKDLDDWTPLHWAAEAGHVETVMELLRHPRVLVDPTDSSRRTPMHFAAVEGGPRQRECIVLLWRRGADLNARMRATNSTPLEVAQECKMARCAALLKSLAHAARDGPPSDAALLAAADAVPETGGKGKRAKAEDAALAAAAPSPSPSVAAAAAAGPAEPRRPVEKAPAPYAPRSPESDSESDSAKTPRGRGRAVRGSRGGALAPGGPRGPHDRPDDGGAGGGAGSGGRSAAAGTGSTSAAGESGGGGQAGSGRGGGGAAGGRQATLLAPGPDASVADRMMYYASTNQYREVVALMASDDPTEAHLVIPNGCAGASPLHAAARCGALDALRLMLYFCREPVNINMRDARGRTALYLAVRHGQLSTVLFLLGRQADVFVRSRQQHMSLLHAAALSSAPAAPCICKLLLKYNLRVNETDVQGHTPLYYAAVNNHYWTLLVLLNDRAVFTDDTIRAARAAGADACASLLERWQAGDRRHYQPPAPFRLQDVSGGLEAIPIPLVNEIDSSLLPLEFGYLAQCVEANDVCVLYDTQKGVCECTGACTEDTCSCIRMALTGQHAVVYECNYLCLCPASCPNRKIQRGRQHKVEVFRTEKKEWGVRAAEPIPAGSFVCEYIGELIDEKEERRRYPSAWLSLQEATLKHAKCAPHATAAAFMPGSYVFDISSTKRIDATVFGNLARFLNHSCAPNLIPVRFFVDHRHTIFARIAFFTRRDVACGEELCYDYGSPSATTSASSPANWLLCQCGAPNCRRRL